MSRDFAKFAVENFIDFPVRSCYNRRKEHESRGGDIIKNVSYRVALGGIVTALCLLLMLLTGVMPLLYLVLPMVAGALLMILVLEISPGWGFLTYCAVSLLSVFVAFDKEAALIFILFFGHYPISKLFLDRIRWSPLRLAVKLCVFGICAAADYFLTLYVLGLDALREEFAGLSPALLAVVFALLTGTFLLYDYSLGGMQQFYYHWFKPKILGK